MKNETVTAWTYTIDGVTIDRAKVQEVKESIKRAVFGKEQIKGDFLTLSLALHELEKEETNEIYSMILKAMEREAFGEPEKE